LKQNIQFIVTNGVRLLLLKLALSTNRSNMRSNYPGKCFFFILLKIIIMHNLFSIIYLCQSLGLVQVN